MRILRKKLARSVLGLLASEVPIGAAALPLQAQLSGHAAYAFPARPRRPPTLRRNTRGKNQNTITGWGKKVQKVQVFLQKIFLPAPLPIMY